MGGSTERLSANLVHRLLQKHRFKMALFSGKNTFPFKHFTKKNTHTHADRL